MRRRGVSGCAACGQERGHIAGCQTPTTRPSQENHKHHTAAKHTHAGCSGGHTACLHLPLNFPTPPNPARTCVFALRACSMVGLVRAALARRLNWPPLHATDSAVGLNCALPVTPLLGAAQSTRVAGARWLPVRLPRTFRGPAPASTVAACGGGEPAGAWVCRDDSSSSMTPRCACVHQGESSVGVRPLFRTQQTRQSLTQNSPPSPKPTLKRPPPAHTPTLHTCNTPQVSAGRPWPVRPR